MKYERDFSLAYDSIYLNKDYKRESEFILSCCGENKDILDIGCGTGNHSVILSQKSKSVTGIDLSEQMIAVAKSKAKLIKNLNFITSSVEDLAQHSEKKYDVIVSLFNVINHIDSLEQLLLFYNSCSTLLKPNGVIMFDCWNSVACIIEKPHSYSESTIKIDQNQKTFVTETKVDSMMSKADMRIGCKETPDIELNLNNLTLWSPRVLTESMKISGIETTHLLDFRDTSKIATETDYRILFIGRKNI